VEWGLDVGVTQPSVAEAFPGGRYAVRYLYLSIALALSADDWAVPYTGAPTQPFLYSGIIIDEKGV